MTGRRITRATRQTASIEEETSLPSPRGQMSSQPRHPIARRGTRRTQLSRRSASVDHLKSSGVIGYDEGDDEVPADGDVMPVAIQNEVHEDAQEVLDRLEIALPRLIRACDEMHAFFARLGFNEPTKKESMELSYAKDGYDLVLERLGVSQEDDYIDVSSFPWNHSSSLGIELPISPREAAYRSNTVSLLSMVTNLAHGQRGTDDLMFFENLDSGFPAYFTAADDPRTALDLAFRIRCHHFSSSLEGPDKPMLVAASIFCGAEFTNQTAARQRLASGPYSPILGLDLNSDEGLKSQFNTNMQDFLDQVLGGRSIGAQAAQKSVEALIPQANLLEDLKAWALKEYQQSSTQQSSAGEVPPAAHQPPTMVEDDASDSDDSDNSEDSDGPVDLTYGAGSTGNYMDGTATTHPAKPAVSAPSISPTLTTLRDLQDEVTDLDTTGLLGPVPYVAPLPRQSVTSSERQRQAENQDVEMGERAATTTITGHHDDHAMYFGDDRPTLDEDEDEDEDEFVENVAAVNQTRRVATTQPARLSRPMPSQAQRSPPVSTRPRPRSSSHVPSRQPMSTQESISPSQMEELRNEAQLNRRTFTHKAEQRRRIPWSQTDEERLIVLIRDYNCVWTQIAEIGGFEVYRDQQAVRDKARNMKVVFLSTDQLLPEKFDKVALSKKEREAVRRAGRNPDRMEDDVDAHDRPVNTLDQGSD